MLIPMSKLEAFQGFLPATPGGVESLKLVTVHLPEAYIEGLEKLVAAKIYPNRSEAIRVAIRDLLKRELWDKEASWKR